MIYQMNPLRSGIFVVIAGLILTLWACQQDNGDKPATVYSDDIYALKEYKVERHPPVVRNGFGMDIYHVGNSGHDSMYMSTRLPSYHPNAPYETGIVLKKYSEELADSVNFEYDLLFFNEFAYSQNYAGDYNGTGYPVIFMYTHPTDDSKSAKAAMIGFGIDSFNGFTADSITPVRLALLTADPLIDLPSLRTELNTSTVNGTVMLTASVADIYPALSIGNKFRPNVGGVFTVPDVDDEGQINYQPVFLVRTREGFYAKFMVTRFKGTGADTQKLTLIWQAIGK
ncbi:MAG: hypothetical protein QM786_11280 [Breznakibacter sp.]